MKIASTTKTVFPLESASCYVAVVRLRAADQETGVACQFKARLGGLRGRAAEARRKGSSSKHNTERSLDLENASSTPQLLWIDGLPLRRPQWEEQT